MILIAKLRSKFLTKETWLYMASFLCLVHCLSLPFLAVLSPAIAHRFENEFFEYAVFVVSVFSGSYVMFLGFKVHHNKSVCFLFCLGALFWLGHSLLESWPFFALEGALFLGTILVIVAYFLNQKNINMCSCCHHLQKK